MRSPITGSCLVFFSIIASMQVNAQATSSLIPARGTSMARLLRSQFIDLPEGPDTGRPVDTLLSRAGRAIVKGNFVEAEKLQAQATTLDPLDHDLQLQSLLLKRIADTVRYSLVTGGYGTQHQLELRRFEEAKRTNSPRGNPDGSRTTISVEENQLLNRYVALGSSCENSIPTLLRAEQYGLSKNRDGMEFCVAAIAVNASIGLSETDRTLVSSAMMGTFLEATGDRDQARKLFLAGRATAMNSQLVRGEAHFDLLLGDLSLMPNGEWQTLGYSQQTDGIARSMIGFGGFPGTRARPSQESENDAVAWYTKAKSLAVDDDDELEAELRYRGAARAYLRGDIPAAISYLTDASTFARHAGFVRMASLAQGTAAILSEREDSLDESVTSFLLEKDLGGIASLVDFAQSYVSDRRSEQSGKRALAVLQMILRVLIKEKVPLGVDGPMDDLASIYGQLDANDQALFWARRARRGEESTLALAEALQYNPDFLEAERKRWFVLLKAEALDIYLHTLAEPSQPWDDELETAEKQLAAASVEDDPDVMVSYEKDKAFSKDRFVIIGKILRVASCDRMDYAGLRDQLLRNKDSVLLDDLNRYLSSCGDPEATSQARSFLEQTDMSGLLGGLKISHSRSDSSQQRSYAAANLGLDQAINSAVALHDFSFLDQWLDRIDAVRGFSITSSLARVEFFLGAGRPREALGLIDRISSNPGAWNSMDDRSKLSLLRYTVESYAASGEAHRSFSSLFQLWRFQSSLHEGTPGLIAQARIRRDTLLHTPPGSRSPLEEEELLHLCLEADHPMALSASEDVQFVMDSMAPNATLLVYFVGMRGWLWTLHGRQTLRIAELSSPRELSTLVNRFNSRFAAGDAQQGWENDSALLYRKLIEPAGPISEGMTVAISGAGYFEGLSFDALGPTSDTLLGLHHPLVYVDNVFAKPRSASKPGKGALVVGVGGLSLPEAEKEAKEVGTLLRATPLLGARATRAAVFARASQAAIVHFSTHGYADAINPYRSYLALSNNEMIEGFELSKLFQSAYMITFSACDTNAAFSPLGSEAGPDFARGLTKFGHQAGATWVLSSLWKADDRASHDITVGYYRALLAGQSPIHALYDAKRSYALQRKRAKFPWFWAGFSLSGAGLQDVSTSRP